MGWFSKAFSGLGSALNPITAVSNITKDVTSKPSFGKFWDSYGNADPLMHGLINAQSSLDDKVTGAGLTGLGAKGLGNYFTKSGNDPTQASLHHVLAGLAYLGGSAALAGGDAAAGGADAASLAGGDTAMGGAAGTLGAADSAAASADLGLTAADLGGGTADVAGLSALDSAAAASDAASVSPGGAADLLLGGGGTDSAAFQAGQYVGQDLAAPTTSSGFGGVGTDPSVSTLSDTGPNYWQQAKDTMGINPASGGSAMQTALNVASKYGPLGLSLMRAAMSKNAENRAAAQIGSTGQLQRQTASGLVSAYNNGTLNPAENASIDQWAQQQTAALRQFYANAGTGDSTQAQQAIAAIQQKAVEMKAQARQNLLQTGLSELNGLDQNTIKAIQLNLQGDQAASKAEADFSQEFFKLLAGQGGMNKTAPAGP